MRMLFVLGFLAAQAWGCSCAVSPTGTPPCQSAWRYDAVFTGTVLEITDPGLPVAPLGQVNGGTGRAENRSTGGASPLPFPQRKVRMKITQALAGLDPDQQEVVIETGLGDADCGYGF